MKKPSRKKRLVLIYVAGMAFMAYVICVSSLVGKEMNKLNDYVSLILSPTF